VLAGSPFDPLYQAIGWLLALLYAIPPHNLGIAIIVLTLIVMAVQFPLIAKQTRSMIQMQRVQPEIKKIQQKYKDDRAKQNEELLKFYQENKINPLAGCLPLLLILPIGIAVFGTFRDPGVQAHVPRTGTFNRLYVDLCGSASTTPTACKEAIKQHTPSAMHFLGLELNLSTADALKDGVLHALPWLILLAFVVFTGWYQVRQTQARQLRQGAPINKQMQTITRVMPLFFGFISYRLNAATTLYFVVSNGWRIGQQHFVLNKMYDEEHPGEAAKKAKAKPKPAIEAGEGDAKEPPAPPPQPRRAPGKTGGASGGGTGNRPPANAARRKKKRKR
jgi:YidC/Oxa1 family membrane protein insertase